MKALILSALLVVTQQAVHAQISYTWNGSASSSWTTPANWTPNGIPGSLDDIRIVTAPNTCMLNTGISINNITLSSGVLDLNSTTLTVTGSTATFTSGTVQNGNLVITAANTTTFGTGTVTMHCGVTITSATISIRNTTFQATVDITKTGSTNDSNNGNNIFNGPSTITNAGAGNILLGNNNPDKFYSTATFNNTGSNHFYIAYNSANNVFAGTTTFNNAPTANTAIYVSWYSAGTTFNNNISVSSSNGAGVQFCGGNATASATLTAGHSITVGSAGFSSGILSLRQFTQAGSTPVNLSLSGSSELRLGPLGNYTGSIHASAPNIYTTTSVFNSTVTLTKTDGTSSNASAGGNTFNADLTVNYISANNTGYWSFGNGLPDVYNGDVYSNNNSLDRIIFGHNSVNNQFNGNLVVTQVGASRGTALTWNNGTSSVMAAGKTISAGGDGISTGYLYIQGFTQNGNEPVNLHLTGNAAVYLGAGNTFNPSFIGGNITVTAPDVYVRGTTFSGHADITKTGGTNNHNDGKQNTFNGALSINQQSNSGYFMLGYNADDQFNGDIIVNSSGTGGISLGWTSGSGKPTLAAGKNISTGLLGYSAGYLQLGAFTQLGTDPINLYLTGTASFNIVNPGTPCSFSGALTVTSPDIYVRGGIFNASATFTKTGGTNNHNDSKENIFNGTLSINQQSSTGYFMLGYNSNDQFNDDIIVSSTGSGGINLGFSSGAGTPTLAAGKTIQTGSAGFSDGYLNLYTFTQLGSAPVNLAFTGVNTTMRFARNSIIGGNLAASSPDIYFDGCTFNGTVDAAKTGTRANTSRGGNVFNQFCSITNNGSNYIILGNNNPDTWNSDVVFTNNGANRILLAWTTAGNQFNGDIYLNTSGSSDGIYFCGGNNTATAVLAAGKTVKAGSAGLNAGYVILKQFTQLGNAPINLTLNATANYLQFGPSSSLGGNVTSVSPGLLFNGCTFNGTVNATKTGAGNDGSSGNNIFNNNTNITNAGTGYLLLGNGNADQFNAAATFNNMGSANLHVAYNSSNNIFGGITTFNNTPAGNTGIYISQYSAGTVFNENIVVSSASGQGVQFCTGNTSATVTLSAGKTISAGGAGFSAGTLLLRQFTQTGSTAQNLTLTGTGRLTFGPSSTFNGMVTSSSAGLFFNGCTFNAVVNATKTGTTDDGSAGNNTFNGTASFTNNGTGYLLMTSSSPDTYNGDVNFVKSNTGLLYPNYNKNGNYAANVSISSSTAVTFGAGAGTATFNGTGAQNLSVTPGTPVPVFTRLTINHSGPGVYLSNTPINVSRDLILTAGLLHTTSAYILTMLNNSTVAAGTALSASYVNGPMRYQKAGSGSSTLNFPIGNGSDCRPVVLTLNHSNGAAYTYYAQLYNASAAALGRTLPTDVTSVSTVHYYTISRTDASGNNQPTTGLSGNQTIQIFFGANDLVTDGAAATIVKNTYNATGAWIDIGGSGAPPSSGGANLTGSITSTSSPTAFNSFSDFAIAFRTLTTLPVEMTDFTAKVNNDHVDLEWTTESESKNGFFTIEKSNDGVYFEAIQTVNSKANGGNSNTPLHYSAKDLAPYTGYNFYRLKQTDTDGEHRYTKTAVVYLHQKPAAAVYPNPTTGTLYIKGLSMNSTQTEWYDLSGRIVLRQVIAVENGVANIHTNLGDGVYILKYTTAKGAWHSERIIIRK